MKIEVDIWKAGFCLMLNYYEFVTDCRRTLIGFRWQAKRWIYPSPIQWYIA